MELGKSVRKMADRARSRIRPDQAERGVDQAADKINKSTNGKYASKVSRAQQKARQAANKYFRQGG